MFGLTLVKVSGESMDPVLPEGSHILFRRITIGWAGNRAKIATNIKLGDIVLVDHPKLGRIVKRIAYLGDDGFELEGISPKSTSRTKMGLLPYRTLRGRMALAYLSSGRWLSPESLPRALADALNR